MVRRRGRRCGDAVVRAGQPVAVRRRDDVRGARGQRRGAGAHEGVLQVQIRARGEQRGRRGRPDVSSAAYCPVRETRRLRSWASSNATTRLCPDFRVQPRRFREMTFGFCEK